MSGRSRLLWLGVAVLLSGRPGECSEVGSSAYTGSRSLRVNGNQFVLEEGGQEKTMALHAGEMHYFRVPEVHWGDRLRRLRAMGLNAVSTYVAWNWHEQKEGTFDWSSERHNITKFFAQAHAHGLMVILRPGPYICAEWDNGGLPAWLLKYSMRDGMKIRHADRRYMGFVRRFWDHLFPIVKNSLLEVGGPVAAVQLENEYGYEGNTNTSAEDLAYMKRLEELARQGLGKKVLLLTTDSAESTREGRGVLPAVLTGVNLGPWRDPRGHLPRALYPARMHNNGGPDLVMELWTGWFQQYKGSKWVEEKFLWPGKHIVQYVQQLLNMNASFCLYMAHGGTNFGQWSAGTTAEAEEGTHLRTSFITTSYDYGAPISEAGGHGYGIDGVDKYLGLREILAPTAPEPLPNEPPPPAMRDYPGRGPEGTIRLWKQSDLLDHAALEALCDGGWVADSEPQPMEMHGQQGGMTLYRFIQERASRTSFLARRYEPLSGELVLRARDRVTVWQGGKVQLSAKMNAIYGMGGRLGNFTVKLQEPTLGPLELHVLVENLGRRSFAKPPSSATHSDSRIDWKGLRQTPSLAHSLLTKGNWSHCALPLADLSATEGNSPRGTGPQNTSNGPAFFEGQVYVSGEPADTFLRLDFGAWHTGVAFINGFNLGRYLREARGPFDLYVPKSVLHTGLNTVVLLEMTPYPVFNSSRPLVGFRAKRTPMLPFLQENAQEAKRIAEFAPAPTAVAAAAPPAALELARRVKEQPVPLASWPSKAAQLQAVATRPQANATASASALTNLTRKAQAQLTMAQPEANTSAAASAGRNATRQANATAPATARTNTTETSQVQLLTSRIQANATAPVSARTSSLRLARGQVDALQSQANATAPRVSVDASQPQANAAVPASVRANATRPLQAQANASQLFANALAARTDVTRQAQVQVNASGPSANATLLSSTRTNMTRPAQVQVNASRLQANATAPASSLPDAAGAAHVQLMTSKQQANATAPASLRPNATRPAQAQLNASRPPSNVTALAANVTAPVSTQLNLTTRAQAQSVTLRTQPNAAEAVLTRSSAKTTQPNATSAANARLQANATPPAYAWPAMERLSKVQPVTSQPQANMTASASTRPNATTPSQMQLMTSWPHANATVPASVLPNATRSAQAQPMTSLPQANATALAFTRPNMTKSAQVQPVTTQQELYSTAGASKWPFAGKPAQLQPMTAQPQANAAADAFMRSLAAKQAQVQPTTAQPQANAAAEAFMRSLVAKQAQVQPTTAKPQASAAAEAFMRSLATQQAQVQPTTARPQANAAAAAFTQSLPTKTPQVQLAAARTQASAATDAYTRSFMAKSPQVQPVTARSQANPAADAFSRSLAAKPPQVQAVTAPPQASAAAAVEEEDDLI